MTKRNTRARPLITDAITWQAIEAFTAQGKHDKVIAAMFGVPVSTIKRIRLAAELDKIKMARWNAEVERNT